MQVPLIRLQCGVNSYDWGKVGRDSAAAKFGAATPSDFSIQEGKPYAELWMGTHPSNPSKDLHTKRTLLDLVQDNQALIGQSITEKYGNKLPFLFKVLSIRKALSIQAHPNKKLAERLHEKDSKNYPDDNHKPEMAIALTEFDGLCGFRPLEEISHYLSNVTALRKLIGESEAKDFQSVVKQNASGNESKKKEALQKLFTTIMNTKDDVIRSHAEELVQEAKKEGNNFAAGGGPSNNGKELSDLVVRLNDQFAGDIGLFCVFIINYVKLQPGEAMFLKADDIHAYLSGDIMECMAASDNVVRAGFTPKYKDVPTLTTMLTYNYAPISEQKMEPVDYPYVTLDRTAYSSGSSSILYDPPIEEFSVVKTELKSTGAKATFEAVAGPSIIICTSGSGKLSVGPKSEDIEPGYVYFVGATAELVVTSTGSAPCTTFKAFCDLQGKEDAEEKEKL